tara:strand:- start:5128 stop:7269 length:2142 start_codon:yes stop_codon:yes gene_type:complete
MKKALLTIFISNILFSSIDFDGHVNNDEWANADKYLIPYEVEPGYNTPAKYKTEAFITHDDNYLYVGFKAYGNQDNTRARIRSRDSIYYLNDFVDIGIDTYADGRYTVSFSVNPKGSIGDRKYSSFWPDASYNVEFEGNGHFTDYGYEAELRIPFTSIDFPETDQQKWKIYFLRKLYENDNETRYLSNKDIEGAGCRICQSDIFYEFSGVKKKSKKRLIPSITANSSAERNDLGEMKRNSPESEISLGGIYELGGNNLEFTINPDFSQIEADESKIDVNSTTALRFEERRIFFNEGRDFLQSRLNSVYTRSINNPSYAVKIFNRGDKHSYYFLDAEDRDTPIIIPGSQRSYSAILGKSHANIFSYKYNLDRGQYLTFLSTNRSYDGGGSGLLYSSRGYIILDKQYSASFEIAKSETDEPISDAITTTNGTKNHTYALDGESFSGYGGRFTFRSNTEKWGWNYEFETKSPDFRTDLGFTSENNWKKHSVSGDYKYRSDGLFKFIRLDGANVIMKNYQNDVLGQMTRIGSKIEFNNAFEVELRAETWNKFQFDDYVFNDTYEYKIDINYSTPKIFFKVSNDWGDAIARNIAVPELGDRKNISANAWVNVTDQLFVGANIRQSKLTSKITGEDFFSGYIGSVKTTYQFNKNSFVKLNYEYNNFNEDSYLQALFQWQPDSATIFYFGGTFNREDIAGTWENESSQIYMKFQYLFNFD